MPIAAEPVSVTVGQDWVTLLQTFGLATMIILFLGICIWRAGGWAGENVVRPVVDRYIKLIDSLIVSVTKQGEAMDKQSAAMTTMAEVFREVARGLADIRRNGGHGDGTGARKA